MEKLIVFLLLAAALGGCTTKIYRAERVKREQQRLDWLMQRNERLIQNIRFYEARLDTQKKMQQGQLKALYRIR